MLHAHLSHKPRSRDCSVVCTQPYLFLRFFKCLFLWSFKRLFLWFSNMYLLNSLICISLDAACALKPGSRDGSLVYTQGLRGHQTPFPLWVSPSPIFYTHFPHKSFESRRQGTWGTKDEPVLHIFHPRDLGGQGLRSGDLKVSFLKKP